MEREEEEEEEVLPGFLRSLNYRNYDEKLFFFYFFFFFQKKSDGRGDLADTLASLFLACIFFFFFSKPQNIG